MDDQLTLRTRLNVARLERFVGREHEIEQFRSALASPDVAILYLHGPGGIGKSSLLDAFSHRAWLDNIPVVRIDARDVDLTPAGLRAAFDRACAPSAALATSRLVILLDTWELAAHIDGWLRDVLLPTLPAEALVVISSRNPPGPEWTVDRAWAPLLRVVGVRNFLPMETEHFVRNQGIAPERAAALAELSYGHPLALALLCDLEQQAGETVGSLTYRDHPDLISALLERCLHTLPRGDERLALAISAHTRVTTEELLREAMQLDDAAHMFDWLRRLSIMQEGPYGIFPHDLARDVIDADFRWRDPTGYAAMHARVRAPIVRRIRSLHGIEQQQATYDLLFLHRNGPVMGRIHHWASLGQGRAEPLTAEDLPIVLEMVQRFEGEESAAIARYWWSRMPDAFVIFRGIGDRVFGCSCFLELSEHNPADSARDPAIAGMWRAIEARNPLRPGEIALYGRFFMDRDEYQASSPGTNLMAMGCAVRWITIPQLAWSFIAPADPEQWGPVFTYLDHHLLDDASFQVGARHYPVYGHDWRVLPPDPWLMMMGEREIAREPPPAAPASVATAQVLSRPDFDQAVRRALRDLYDARALERNPLTRSRLVIGSSDGAPATVLRDQLLAAITFLEKSPRDAKLHRAIHHTFVQPAGSQELAAELLDLPFNTYRYHLSGGIRRIVDELWRIELGL